MNDPTNALRAWAQFYDQNFGPVFANTSGSFAALNGGGGYDAALKSNANRNSKMQFLQQMMNYYPQGQPEVNSPDFFSGLPQQPDNSQGYNRLASLLGRRF